MNKDDLLEKGYRRYRGTELDVYYNIAMCQHAAVCVRGSSKVFDKDRKPWINPDGETADIVKNLIDRCPSHALLYLEKDGLEE